MYDDNMYEQFTSALQEKVEERAGEIEGLNEVTIDHTIKNNDPEAQALTARFEGDGNMAPSIYLRPLYEDYKGGRSLDEIADQVVQTMEESHRRVEGYNFDLGSLSGEDVKDRLFLKLVNSEHNAEMVGKCTHIELQDLVAIPRLEVYHNDGGVGSILVDREIQTRFLHMTDEELIRACRNNLEKQDFKIQGMSEVLRDLMPGMPDDMVAEMMPPMQEPERMYVMSNAERQNGAIALLSKDALAQAREKIGEDFFVISSSIHEVLCIPESAVDNPADLHNMNREVNESCVLLEDQLGDTIYHCDGKNLDICNTREQLEEIREARAESFGLGIGEDAGRDISEGFTETTGHSIGRGM